MEWTQNLMFERVGLPWILSRIFNRLHSELTARHLTPATGQPGPREAEWQEWSGEIHSTGTQHAELKKIVFPNMSSLKTCH